MTSRRSNRASARVRPHVSPCRLCGCDLTLNVVPRVAVSGHEVCLACAIRVHEGLRDIYAMPEITVLDRLRYEKEHGPSGLRRTPLSAVNDPGWVYYIRMGDVIKIGYAKDVARRMRAYPPSAMLLAAHPGTPAVERDMHKRFSADLDRGREWFRESEALVAHIESVIEKFGAPEGMAYEYTRPKTQEERVADMFRTKPNYEVAPGGHLVVR